MHATIKLPGQSAQLPKESPTDAANPMHPCSDIFLPTDVSTDFEKSRGIFKILV